MKVKVGDELLAFKATTSEGAKFHTSGQEELEKRDIRVVALSKDRVEEAAIHQKGDGRTQH